MRWYQRLHWKIIIGMVAGLFWGVLAAVFGWQEFTFNWISPWGQIFINLLKLIAVPLVLTSLIVGVASLSDIKKLSRMGGRTIGIYLLTTTFAVSIGLGVVNILNPGKAIPSELTQKLKKSYETTVASKSNKARQTSERRPLQPLVEMVPANIIESSSNNKNMLQVVVVAILFGIALIQIEAGRSKQMVELLDVANEVVLKVVDMAMILAPFGVFSLLANTIVSVAGDDISEISELVGGLGYYCITVILGLLVHSLIVFPFIIKFLTPMKLKTFFKGIAPAQLLAFSTSSSGATLPVTMERCEQNLGVEDEVTSFVLPLGSTVNMDGTSLYQAVAAVFIAQATGIDLSFADQLTIIFTAVLASVGTVGVPGAGIIMLLIVLEAVGVPSAGIALILGVDRILDMLRTVVNVTGDAAVCVLVAHQEGQLGKPDLDDEPHMRMKNNELA
ncbi:MAG: dicarboxylate/amino acid:cation symporter [Halobacteriovoraceae bacterium]|nr:dicarboxylate/amino acid:cation symporter [Halobacteriovoraceae bacterium]|tara:strand:+ start:8961 stop:10298 length:1338 start_codon:yes stop_codon:yes gene_type:complete